MSAREAAFCSREAEQTKASPLVIILFWNRSVPLLVKSNKKSTPLPHCSFPKPFIQFVSRMTFQLLMRHSTTTSRLVRLKLTTRGPSRHWHLRVWTLSSFEKLIGPYVSNFGTSSTCRRRTSEPAGQFLRALRASQRYDRTTTGAHKCSKGRQRKGSSGLGSLHHFTVSYAGECKLLIECEALDDQNWSRTKRESEIKIPKNKIK